MKQLIKIAIIFTVLNCFSAIASVVEHKLEIKSSIVKQTLDFSVFVPADYETETEQKYVVVLTTAGRSRLQTVVQQVQWLSHVDFAPLPRAITVSMPYIDPEQLAEKSVDINALYVEVFKQELFPLLAKKFRTHPYRIIEGFSTWANLPLSIYRDHPETFNAYFVFAPALELADDNFVSKFSAKKFKQGYRNRALFLSRDDFAGNQTRFERLQSLLERANEDKLTQIIVRDYRQHNYLSNPNIGLVEATEAVFADLAPDFDMFSDSGVDGLEVYLDGLVKKYGFDMDKTGKTISMAFHFADSKAYVKAFDVMEHVIANEPDNLLAHVRLAQLQMLGAYNNEALKTLEQASKMAEQQQDHEVQSFVANLKRQLLEG